MEQTMYHNTVKRGGISSSSLKIIAVISMLTDHFAAGVLGRYLTASGLYGLDVTDTDGVMLWMGQGHNMQLLMAYQIMRMIGRIAFPIYCFLLVEGFEHTKNRIKYAQRLLLFAAASEIPFDLLFKGKILEFGYQNVFFTLFFGLAVMMGLSWVQEHLPVKGKAAAASRQHCSDCCGCRSCAAVKHRLWSYRCYVHDGTVFVPQEKNVAGYRRLCCLFVGADGTPGVCASLVLQWQARDEAEIFLLSFLSGSPAGSLPDLHRTWH